jgi:hypothetical protein
MNEDLVRFIEVNEIKLIANPEFDFSDAPTASRQ